MAAFLPSAGTRTVSLVVGRTRQNTRRCAEFLNLVVQRAARGVGVQRLLLELLDARGDPRRVS